MLKTADGIVILLNSEVWIHPNTIFYSGGNTLRATKFIKFRVLTMHSFGFLNGVAIGLWIEVEAKLTWSKQ